MLDDPANPDLIPDQHKHFKNYEDMERSLKAWLKQVPGGVGEELLGISVVIELDNDALRDCGILASNHDEMAENQ